MVSSAQAVDASKRAADIGARIFSIIQLYPIGGGPGMVIALPFAGLIVTSGQHFSDPCAGSTSHNATDIARAPNPGDCETEQMNGRQFVYHMHGLTKTYPGNRKVLENVNLSFYPDAKIGVLGVNGAGKSTLLRIMAGLDKDFSGEAWAAEGARVGYLPQEPHLDPDKSVRENVMEGVAASKAILERYNELAANYSDE